MWNKFVLILGLFLLPISQVFSQDYVEYSTTTIGFSDYEVTAFHFGSGDTIGELTWENGYFEFKGDTDESAKMFFEYLKGYLDSWMLESYCEERFEQTEK